VYGNVLQRVTSATTQAEFPETVSCRGRASSTQDSLGEPVRTVRWMPPTKFPDGTRLALTLSRQFGRFSVELPWTPTARESHARCRHRRPEPRPLPRSAVVEESPSGPPDVGWVRFAIPGRPAPEPAREGLFDLVTLSTRVKSGAAAPRRILTGHSHVPIGRRKFVAFGSTISGDVSRRGGPQVAAVEQEKIPTVQEHLAHVITGVDEIRASLRGFEEDQGDELAGMNAAPPCRHFRSRRTSSPRGRSPDAREDEE
jgi:hypothetical protein